MFLKTKIIDSKTDLSIVAAHPEIDTSSESYVFYKFFFIYPAFLLWILVYPLLIIVGMRWYKKQLADREKKDDIRPWILFGFIMMGYEIRG